MFLAQMTFMRSARHTQWVVLELLWCGELMMNVMGMGGGVYLRTERVLGFELVDGVQQIGQTKLLKEWFTQNEI